MLQLAWPTIVVLIMQTLVGIAEIYFVSFLGTIAVAGVTLVFPLLMLMTMMSNGGIGGGVASAIGRALGAERKGDADALVLHAFVLAVVLGLVFTVAEALFGRAFYQTLGGSGAVLDTALAYSHVVFAGAVFAWLTALLSAALRASGNVVFPAAVSIGGFLLLLPLSPALIFGLGPMPRLGAAGAGTAIVVYFAIASTVLIAYVRSSRSPLRLRFDPRLLRLRLFADVLRVGGISAIGAVQANLSVIVVTGIVGSFGSNAIAGYGLASRLDYLQIPLLFGLGTAVVTMVATNIGARQVRRAYAVAWLGAAIAFAFTEMLGLLVTAFPSAWLGLFTRDPLVLATGAGYLHAVAPFYGMSGAGLLLYFASQGLGRVIWPVMAGTARLLIATLAGFVIAVHMGYGLTALFAIVAIAYFAFGAIIAVAFRLIEHSNVRSESRRGGGAANRSDAYVDANRLVGAARKR
jgi:putative MATE family efflux protein